MDSLTTLYLVIWIFSILFLGVLGVLIMMRTKRILDERKLNRTWPTTTGRVLSAAIEQRKRRATGRDIFGNPLRITVHQPVITYSYESGNKPYQSSVYKNSWPGEWATPNLSEAQSVLANYPAGKTVQVHYNPADPAQAFLELEKSGTGLMVFQGLGIILLAAAAVILVLGVNSLVQDAITRGERAAIAKSPAVLKTTATQIKTEVESKLGLSCQSEGFAGTNVAYRGWACKGSTQDKVNMVDIYSRRDEPEKVDMVWVIMDRTNADKNQAFMESVAGIAAPEADPQAVQKWLAESMSALSQTNPRITTTIQGIPFVLYIPSETRLNFLIGASK